MKVLTAEKKIVGDNFSKREKFRKIDFFSNGERRREEIFPSGKIWICSNFRSNNCDFGLHNASKKEFFSINKVSRLATAHNVNIFLAKTF